MEKRVPEVLTTGEVAKLLNLSPDMVRALERGGRLNALKTASGRRVFSARDVERLARERAARRTSRPGANGTTE